MIDEGKSQRIFVIENHDEAYYIWRKAGVKHRTLIHVDAHHDMWWIKDQGSITIANFICPALKDDIVQEVFWVVPDATWDTAKSRKPILQHLKRITARYPGNRSRVQVDRNKISTLVLGKPLCVCSLNSLPKFDAPVLLDIDVDFEMIPRISYRQSDEHCELPWCWPEDLLARLGASNVRADIATIALSVEGSYTPLKWKYLGDELALRLNPLNHGGPSIHGMTLMRQASLAAQSGDAVSAEEKYHQASRLLTDTPAPYYHLAELYIGMDRLGEARKAYELAVALSPSYRTIHNSAGMVHRIAREPQTVERELRRMLMLEPQDPIANLGLGRLAIIKKRWEEASASLRKALELDSHLVDAYRALGEVLVKQGRHEEAIKALERSLNLVLKGYKPLEKPIATYVEENQLRDPDHCRIHAQLAQLYALKGETREAIIGYRMAIAGNYDNFVLRVRLARLYLKQREWRKAAQEVRQAFMRAIGKTWKSDLNPIVQLRGR